MSWSRRHQLVLPYVYVQQQLKPYGGATVGRDQQQLTSYVWWEYNRTYPLPCVGIKGGRTAAAKSPKEEAYLWAPPLWNRWGANSAAFEPHVLHYGKISGGDEQWCGNGSVLRGQVLLYSSSLKSLGGGITAGTLVVRSGKGVCKSPDKYPFNIIQLGCRPTFNW